MYAMMPNSQTSKRHFFDFAECDYGQFVGPPYDGFYQYLAQPQNPGLAYVFQGDGNVQSQAPPLNSTSHTTNDFEYPLRKQQKTFHSGYSFHTLTNTANLPTNLYTNQPSISTIAEQASLFQRQHLADVVSQTEYQVGPHIFKPCYPGSSETLVAARQPPLINDRVLDQGPYVSQQNLGVLQQPPLIAQNYISGCPSQLLSYHAFQSTDSLPMGNGKEASETSNSQVAEGSGCVDTTTSLGFETLHMHPPQNSQVEIIDGPATIGTLPAGVVPQSYAVIQTPYEPALAQDYLQSSSSLCPSQLPDVSPGSTPNRDIFTVPGGEGSNWAVYQPQPPQIAHDGSILLGEVQSSPGSLVYESETSTDQTPPLPRRTQRTRGPFVDEKMKNDTAKTRRLGCCIRCRMQRIRCVMKDGSSQCDTCTKAQPKVWRLPCVRYNITDMQLYKPTGGVENLRWTERWSDVVFEISTWASSTVRKIRIGDRYTSGFVEVPVREFKPQPGDKLVRTWTTPDGQKKSVPVPNYAICDLKRAGAEFHKYLETGFCECFETVAKPVDDMMLRTYKLAWSIYQDPNLQEPKKEVLDKALKLWMCIRLTTTSQTIVGEDTLDMSRDIMDETSPIHGKIPLPPVMGAQIDLILIETIQKSLRKRLLKLLQEMARKNDKSTWLVLYLVTFIMLHNIALITAHDAGYAQKHGLERRFAREKKVSEYHLGANILLSYWHYCCKGLYPFSEGCSQKELESLAELDEGEIRYVRDMREYISNERDKWDEIHRAEQYENDFYFVSQIFQRGWEPGSTKTFTHV